MQKFYKKCAVIYDTKGEPMFVCDVLDFETALTSMIVNLKFGDTYYYLKSLKMYSNFCENF